MFWKVGYFIRDFWEEKGGFKDVLDVGSQNFNGSVKDFISGYDKFTGVDMLPGKDVDLVLNGHDLYKHFSADSFDLVTCCETFEHDDKFWETLEQMKRVLKPGGYLLITCPGLYFMHHDFPSDFYRFTIDAVKSFFEGYEDVVVEEFADPNDQKEKPNTSIMGYGRKPE